MKVRDFGSLLASSYPRGVPQVGTRYIGCRSVIALTSRAHEAGLQIADLKSNFSNLEVGKYFVDEKNADFEAIDG